MTSNLLSERFPSPGYQSLAESDRLLFAILSDDDMKKAAYSGFFDQQALELPHIYSIIGKTFQFQIVYKVRAATRSRLQIDPFPDNELQSLYNSIL